MGVKLQRTVVVQQFSESLVACSQFDYNVYLCTFFPNESGACI